MKIEIYARGKRKDCGLWAYGYPIKPFAAWDEIEKIGNIFDTPELLEGVKP